jgi:hypothetical protein
MRMRWTHNVTPVLAVARTAHFLTQSVGVAAYEQFSDLLTRDIDKPFEQCST